MVGGGLGEPWVSHIIRKDLPFMGFMSELDWGYQFELSNRILNASTRHGVSDGETASFYVSLTKFDHRFYTVATELNGVIVK